MIEFGEDVLLRLRGGCRGFRFLVCIVVDAEVIELGEKFVTGWFGVFGRHRLSMYVDVTC